MQHWYFLNSTCDTRTPHLGHYNYLMDNYPLLCRYSNGHQYLIDSYNYSNLCGYAGFTNTNTVINRCMANVM